MRWVFVLFLLAHSIHSIKSQSLEEQAVNAFEQGDLALSESLYLEVIANSSSLSKQLSISIALAELYEYDYNSEKALRILNRYLEFGREQINQDSIFGLALHKKGVSYYNLYEYEKAIQEWENAIALREEIFDINDLSILKSYANLGAAYKELSLHEKSYDNLKTSVERHFKNEIIDSSLLARSYKDMCSALCQLEDIERAHNYLLLTQELYKKLYSGDPLEMPKLYDLENEYYSRIGDYQKAIQSQNKKINLLESYDDLYEEDVIHIANAYNNIGISNDLLGQYDLAISAYNNSITQNELLEDRDFSLFDNFLNISDSYSNYNKIDSALLFWNKAYQVIDIDNAPVQKLYWLINGSEYYSKKGLINKTLEYLTITENHIKKHDVDLPMPLLLDILFLRADINMKLYNETSDIQYLKESGSFYQKSQNLVGQIVSTYLSDKSKIHVNNKVNQEYEKGISTFIKLFQKTENQQYIYEALKLSEQAKTIALLSSLTEDKQKSSSNIPKVLLKKEDEINKKISELNRLKAREDGANVDDQIASLNLELEDINSEIEQYYPKFKNIRSSKDTQETHDFIDSNDKLIIEYFQGKDNFHIFTIYNGSYSYSMISKDRITELIRTIRICVQNSFTYHIDKKEDEIDKNKSQYIQAGIELYDLIISPALEQHNHEDILIIPDGQINLLPFDLLITEPINSKTAYSEIPYLIKKHNVSYAYSLNLLQEMVNNNTQAKENLIAFAPEFKLGSKSVDYSRKGLKNTSLGPLYFNKKEVNAISQIIEGDIYVDEFATELNFIEHVEDYKIVHLSTHGKANEEIGDFAYLAFTPIEDSIENEFVYNQDLYQLNLNAEMVVLSACETGIGEIQGGEGIISLARGFSYAGAKSVITTLWSINDLKTMQIMSLFYQNINSKKNKDISLRKAKLDFIATDDNPLPFYWAAFIPIGDMSPIVNSGFNPLITLSIIGILLIIILIYIIKWSQQRKRIHL